MQIYFSFRLNNFTQYLFSLELPKDTDTYSANASVGYNILMQELARMSAYFCEKAGAGGLIGVHLLTFRNPLSFVVSEVSVC